MFGNILKHLRKEKKLKQSDLANTIKKTQATIYKLETNKLIPPIETFISICEALKVTYEELKELHLEYEKLLKPFKAKELIFKEFPKSEYILKLIFEDIHFKDNFFNYYHNTFEGNRIILFFNFIKLIYFLIGILHIDNKEFNAKSFYKCIDISKIFSEQIFNLYLSPVPSDIEKRILILKELTKKVREYYKNNGKIDKNFIEKLLSQYNIPAEDIPELTKILKSKDIYANNAFFDDDLNINYRDITTQVNVVFIENDKIKQEPDFRFLDIQIYYDKVAKYLYQTDVAPIIIESKDHKFYEILFDLYVDEFSIIDVLSQNKEDHITYRVSKLSDAFEYLIKFFETERIEDNFVALFVESLHNFIRTLHKEYVEMEALIEARESEVENLQKQISKLKDRIKQLEEENKLLKSSK